MDTIFEVVLVVFLESAVLSGNLKPEGYRQEYRWRSLMYPTECGEWEVEYVAVAEDDYGMSVGLIPRQTGRVSEMVR